MTVETAGAAAAVKGILSLKSLSMFTGLATQLITGIAHEFNLEAVELAAPVEPTPIVNDEHLPAFTHTGDDPVAHAGHGKTAVENAYEGSDPNMDVEKDMSPIMQSARAVADAAGMPVGSPERIAFLNSIQDRTGQEAGVLTDGSKVIMADGPGGGHYGAKKMIVDGGVRGVKDAEFEGVRGTYTWVDADGHTHERSYTILNACANPALDVNEQQPEPTAASVPPPGPAPTCPDEHGWRGKTVESKGGIDMDGNPGTPPDHKIPVIEAPSHMTLEKALDDLGNKILSGEITVPDDGKEHHFLLWIDEDCDGHPDKIECVCVVRHGAEVSIKVEPLDTKPGPGVKYYDDLETPDQKKWINTP